MMNSYLLLLTVSMTTVYHQDLWWFIILVFWKSNSCIFILNFFFQARMNYIRMGTEASWAGYIKVNLFSETFEFIP